MFLGGVVVNFALSDLVLVGSDRVVLAPSSSKFLLQGAAKPYRTSNVNVKPLLFILNGVTVLSRLAMIRFC